VICASAGKCDISKHGAHVLSWSPSADAASGKAHGEWAGARMHCACFCKFMTSQQRAVLYMSPTAKYGANDAIRGGIPICFPQ
jgi:D-hexose-6-phosphate mutarotase